MTCPSCRTLSCYICRQQVQDYSHFCQTAHCKHKKCGKCVLYTNADEDDAMAMREAGLKAASEVETRNADNDVRIDVDSILKDPNANGQKK